VRPGRFDRIIAVPLPDIRGRAQILKHHMKDVIIGKGSTFLALSASFLERQFRCGHQDSCTGHSRLLRSRPAEHGQVSGRYSCALVFPYLLDSQAAIQASKEHAAEVSLKHFEWAKVW
jgi:ATP-dependent metalloprotease